MVLNKYNDAISYLNSTAKKYDEEELALIEEIICHANIYSKLAKNPDLQDDLPELLSKCTLANSKLKSGNFLNNVPSNNVELIEQVTLDIVPHPVGTNSTIIVNGLTQAGKIDIFTVDGSLVFTDNVDSEVYNLYISNTEYKSGIYLIRLSTNGATLKTTKMVITE